VPGTPLARFGGAAPGTPVAVLLRASAAFGSTTPRHNRSRSRSRSPASRGHHHRGGGQEGAWHGGGSSASGSGPSASSSSWGAWQGQVSSGSSSSSSGWWAAPGFGSGGGGSSQVDNKRNKHDKGHQAAVPAAEVAEVIDWEAAEVEAAADGLQDSEDEHYSDHASDDWFSDADEADLDDDSWDYNLDCYLDDDGQSDDDAPLQTRAQAGTGCWQGSTDDRWGAASWQAGSGWQHHDSGDEAEFGRKWRDSDEGWASSGSGWGSHPWHGGGRDAAPGDAGSAGRHGKGADGKADNLRARIDALVAASQKARGQAAAAAEGPEAAGGAAEEEDDDLARAMAASKADPSKVKSLMELGISKFLAGQALEACGNDVSLAADWAMSRDSGQAGAAPRKTSTGKVILKPRDEKKKKRKDRGGGGSRSRSRRRRRRAEAESAAEEGQEQGAGAGASAGASSSSGSGVNIQPVQASEKSVGSCVICMSAPAEYACVPCGHQCLCSECKTSLPTCPVCRAPIQQVLRIFVASAD